MNKRTVKITKNSILLLHIFMCFISCGKPNKNADYNNYPDALQIEVYLKDIVRTFNYTYGKSKIIKNSKLIEKKT